MVDAAARPALLTLLDEREAGDSPPASSRAPPPRRWLSPPRLASAAPGALLVEPLDESVRMAVRREPDRRLVGVSLGEVADPPGVGGVEAVAHHPRERLLAAAFQLDEGLRLLVQTERGRLAVVGRPEPIARHDPARLLQRVLAIHRDVERDDGEGLREVVIADEAGGDRQEPEQQPESRTLHASGSFKARV